MGASATLVVVFVVIIAAVLGLWAYRRATPSKGPPVADSKEREHTEQWGVRISATDRERACPPVREILGKEFTLPQKPPLPVANCPFPHQCECRYVKLFDRRKGDRRSGHDRRVKGQRFEKDKIPRRSGKDRRRKIDWF